MLSQQILDDVAVDVGQAEVAALAAEGEAFVIDTKLVQDGGVEVVDVDFVLGGVVAKLICGTVGDAGFHAPSGHPHGETVRVVVAAPGLTHDLSDWRATKLTTPDH